MRICWTRVHGALWVQWEGVPGYISIITGRPTLQTRVNGLLPSSSFFFFNGPFSILILLSCQLGSREEDGEEQMSDSKGLSKGWAELREEVRAAMWANCFQRRRQCHRLRSVPEMECLTWEGHWGTDHSGLNCCQQSLQTHRRSRRPLWPWWSRNLEAERKPCYIPHGPPS